MRPFRGDLVWMFYCLMERKMSCRAHTIASVWKIKLSFYSSLIYCRCWIEAKCKWSKLHIFHTHKKWKCGGVTCSHHDHIAIEKKTEFDENVSSRGVSIKSMCIIGPPRKELAFIPNTSVCVCFSSIFISVSFQTDCDLSLTITIKIVWMHVIDFVCVCL